MDGTSIHKPCLNLHFNMHAPGVTWAMATGSRLDSNCYAYSLNLPQSLSAIPGNIAEAEYRDMKKNEFRPRIIKERLLKDGLDEISSGEALSGAFHAVACIMAPFQGFRSQPDFHFLRFDHESGTWSHKRRNSFPLDVDDEGAPIGNPETAKFKGYDAFCGFFAIPAAGVPYVARGRKENALYRTILSHLPLARLKDPQL